MRILILGCALLLTCATHAQEFPENVQDLPDWMYTAVTGKPPAHAKPTVPAFYTNRFVGTATIDVGSKRQQHVSKLLYWADEHRAVVREMNGRGVIMRVLLADLSAGVLIEERFGGNPATFIFDMVEIPDPMFEQLPLLRASGRKRTIAKHDCSELIGPSLLKDHKSDTVRYWVSDMSPALFHDYAVWSRSFGNWTFRAISLLAMSPERTALAVDRGNYRVEVVYLSPGKADMPLLDPAPTEFIEQRAAWVKPVEDNDAVTGELDELVPVEPSKPTRPTLEEHDGVLIADPLMEMPHWMAVLLLNEKEDGAWPPLSGPDDRRQRNAFIGTATWTMTTHEVRGYPKKVITYMYWADSTRMIFSLSDPTTKPTVVLVDRPHYRTMVCGFAGNDKAQLRSLEHIAEQDTTPPKYAPTKAQRGAQRELVGVPCREYVLPTDWGIGAKDTIRYWVAEGVRGPISDLAPWTPLSFRDIYRFSNMELVHRGQLMLMTNSGEEMRVTHLKRGPVPMPRVDLARFKLCDANGVPVQVGR